MTKQAVKAKTTSKRGIENCRVLEIGIDKFAECLQQGPRSCSYAMPFGYCFLCCHPQLDEIIKNSKKAQLAVAVHS